MPTMMTQSVLGANLAALGERNEDVAQRLRATAPASVEFAETPQDAASGTHDGVQLASRHRPLDEAARLADTIDVIENAAIVVLGFGLGWHVKALAERMKKAGLIIVVEPDVALLRAVLEHIDHSDWMNEAMLVFITDCEDRGALGRKLQGSDPILVQGIAFLEHPPRRTRMAEDSRKFCAMFTDYVTAAKTTLITTLVRSVDTVRNLLHNADHYAGGGGAAELKDAARGRLAIVVSAGPSLNKNLHLLADPAVRERCVIIAVQTTLKPLLAAGIRPHFVTALDYHEISKRFYEGITAADVEGVTLVADPKAHPAILDAFPGAVRCCKAGFLDRVLGELQRDMGDLPAGATVAHLAVYIARYMGCDPIAMIGQDLGFPDGLYYAPGTAIHDVWAPELNPFNTIAMMEWQRIVRHRAHLHKKVDVRGRSIYTDAQMLTYLHQFERDFAECTEAGIDVIDATEGGVAKQHTRAMPLRDVLTQYATEPLSPLPNAPVQLDRKRMAAAERRFADVQRDVGALREISRKTAALVQTMLDEQDDAKRMDKHFAKVEGYRKQVEERFAAFELINHLNQLGVYKRMKADRRIHLAEGLNAAERQRAQLERDLTNVQWIAEAAEEMVSQLADARRLLRGERISDRPRPVKMVAEAEGEEPVAIETKPCIAALVPIDPQRNGMGIRRSLTEPFQGQPVIQATLERLGSASKIESIVLIAPEGFDVGSLIDRDRIGRPVHVERCPSSPFGPEQEAIAAARLFADTCWRGGVAGMSVYDEVLCPVVMNEIMQKRGLTAALLAAPDWPLIDVSPDSGCDALIERHLERPDQHRVVFTQAPPGLCGCVVNAELMNEMTQRTRLSTIGGLLAYQPHMPRGDAIATDANVQIDANVRHALIRATFDSPRHRRALQQAMTDRPTDASAIVSAIEAATNEGAERSPQHIILELNTDRPAAGEPAHHPFDPVRRPPLSRELAQRIFSQLRGIDDCLLTLAGLGDPLLHDEFDAIIRMAKDAGVLAVHVRTELVADKPVLDRLLACGADVVSVEMHADCAATYERMHGADRFKLVLENMQHLLENRRNLAGPAGVGGIGLPWIVPRIRRCDATYEDIDTFFSRWQHTLGTAVIEAPPAFPRNGRWPGDQLSEAVTPLRVVHRELGRRMTIFSDGSVPISELDLPCERPAGNVADAPLTEIWRCVFAQQREWMRTGAPDAPELRIYQP